MFTFIRTDVQNFRGYDLKVSKLTFRKLSFKVVEVTYMTVFKTLFNNAYRIIKILSFNNLHF